MADYLNDAFLTQAENRPAAPALCIAGDYTSYGQLLELALRAANFFQSCGAGPGHCVGILSSGTEGAYAAELGALLCGAAFVPTNPRFPPERNLAILKRTACCAALLDSRDAARYAPTLAACDPLPLAIHGPYPPTIPGTSAPRPLDDFAPDRTALLDAPDPESLCYVLFTSGTTGIPKGVTIKRGSLTQYLKIRRQQSPVTTEDRFIQTNDLSFDVAQECLWRTLQDGACLYEASLADRLSPAFFLSRHRITQFIGVPSLLMQLRRQRCLTPDAFPEVRNTMLAGEGLPADLTRAWQQAAPHSVIDNLYGPTEATVTCIGFRISPGEPVAEAANGQVPMGEPFADMSVRLVTTDGTQAPDGAPGELWLSGPQLSPGYLDSPEQNARAFVEKDGKRWYKTGDLVFRGAHGLVFAGRVDSQIKLHGFRIELEEVEAALRKISGTTVLAGTVTDSHGNLRLVAALDEECPMDDAAILQACRKLLPDYMVPGELRRVRNFPVNINGKLDRHALFGEA